MPLLYDLRYKVVRNHSRISFWTSDNPVVFYNQLLETIRPYANNIGWVTKGLEIFYPISPKLCLVFFDTNVYGLGKKDDDFVESFGEADVEQMNLLQFVNANENLYFNESLDEHYVQEFVNKFETLRRDIKVVTCEFPHPTDPLRTYVFQHEVEVRINLRLSYLRKLKKAQKQIGDLKSERNVVIPRTLEVLALAEELDRGKKK